MRYRCVSDIRVSNDDPDDEHYADRGQCPPSLEERVDVHHIRDETERVQHRYVAWAKREPKREAENEAAYVGVIVHPRRDESEQQVDPCEQQQTYEAAPSHFAQLVAV